MPHATPPTTDPETFLEPQPSRYVVGIDLGTTNSAVCYVDCLEKPWQVRVLGVPQLVAPGQTETRDTLPSFQYQPPESKVATNQRTEEPKSYVVGFMARDYGALAPGRLISSAKSWLCHSGVDRTAELLPWHAASDVERISPITASSRYLAHIRAAWDGKFKGEPLERQDVVLTLPASFDEIARELTIEAAAKAGLQRVVLIEEPQAAFYAWIYKNRNDWDLQVSPGQKILVCDIGGGTTDFTLIRVRRGTDGKVQFHRVAVGDHLLLGGDNMDLALAQYLEGKLCNQESRSPRLEPRQWDALLRQSRYVKELMLGDEAPVETTVTLPGTGARLLGSGLSTRVTRDEARELLVEGFMPLVELKDKLQARRSGFQEYGLPFAADHAITRYLAAFLKAHRHAGEECSGFGVQGSGEENKERGAEDRGANDPAHPDVVLFNGGVFESTILRRRILDSLSYWYPSPEPQGPSPVVLDNDRLDLAVARGAAYYGMVRRGEGVKIVASLARTYYIGVESVPPAALCLVPGNAEPGQSIELANRQFDLLVSEPVEFPLFTSSVRLTDQPGELVPVDPEQMTALPPIRTALKVKSRRERGTVAVHLHAKLTEIGTLELWCSEVGGERSWRLQFDVRSATQTEIDGHETRGEAEGIVDEGVAAACRAVLESAFGPGGSADPHLLTKQLALTAASERDEWPTSLLRRIWEMLMELESGRRKSPQHEARWLNLLGYALRPGYGLAVDDWRVAETWKTVLGKLSHAAATSRTESLVLWRRIAGGLSAGQQRAIAEPLLATVRAIHKRQTGSSVKSQEISLQPHESREVLRLLGALELLPVEVKIELGRMILDLIGKKKFEPIRPALTWAIGRLGSREPAYGPLNTVVPALEASKWIEELIATSTGDAIAKFAVVNLARRTHDRFRDIEEPTMMRVMEWLVQYNAGEHARRLVVEGGQLDRDEQEFVFGESLPKGLRLR